MNKQRKEYFYLSYSGNYTDIASLPKVRDIHKSDIDNRPITLIPDNNVCTHVSDLNICKQDKLKKAKAESFLEYIHSSNITVNPTWALLERASKPGTLNLDKIKLKDFEDAFWKKLYRYSDNDLLTRSVESIDFMKSVLYPMYAYLLKIKLILSKREPSSDNVTANLTELCEFMDDMQLFSVIIWQFSLAIFGGDNQFNKLIKPKRGDVFKALWGAAWDIYYLQLPHMFYGIREINNLCPQYIFATDDRTCAKLGSLMKVIGGIDCGRVIYNYELLNFNFPHFKNRDSFLFKISHEIVNKVTERILERKYLSEEESQRKLQITINNSSEYILKFTQELNNVSKKGFKV